MAWLLAWRWWAPLAIGLAVLCGRLVGLPLATAPVLAVAASMWGYNAVLAWLERRLRRRPTTAAESRREAVLSRRLVFASLGLDGAAVFALVQLSAGLASPLLPFLLWPVVLAALGLGKRWAWLVAGLIVAGLAAGTFLDRANILAVPGAHLGDAAPTAGDALAWDAVRLACFASAAFLVATVTACLVERLRRETERAAETQAALAAERARFLLQVAHNLRAPLDASVSMLDVVRQGYAGELAEPQRQTLERVRGRLAMLATVVSELLLLGRTREMATSAKVGTVDLAAVTRTVVATFADLARQRSLQLQVDLPETPLWVASDAAILRQVIENLLSNGLKYTPPGGTVWLAAAAVGDRIELRVRDTGIGIPIAEQPRLFEPFYRAKNARSVEGTGLGLAFVKEAVERQGGTVALWSREGQGSEFVIRLPAAQPPSDGAAQVPGGRLREPETDGPALA